MTRRLILAAGLALGAMLASDAVYYGLVVPRLPGWRSVPLEWWAFVFLPCLIAALVIGSLLRGWRDILPFALALAAIRQLHEYGSVLLQLPGTAKSFVAEAPAEFWTVFSLLAIVESAVAPGVILAARRWLGESSQLLRAR